MRRKVVRNWVLTYLIIWAIPFSFSILNYHWAEVSLKESINEINTLNIKNAASEFMGIFSEVSRWIDALNEDELYQQIRSMSDEEFNSKRESTRKIVRQISVMTEKNDNIDQICILLPNLETVLTAKGFCPKAYFYATYFSETDMTEEEFQNIDSQFHSGTFLRLQRPSSLSNIILYVKSIEGGFGNKFQNVYVMINEKFLMSEFIQSNFISDGTFLILENNGGVVAANCEDELAALLAEKMSGKEKEIVNFALDGKDYIAVAERNKIDGRMYAYMQEESVFYTRLNFFRNASTTGMICCLGLGILVILLVTRKNYMPIRAIITMIGGKNEAGMYRDEYEYIQQKIHENSENMKSMRSNLRKSEQSIAEFELHKIIHGEYSDCKDMFRHRCFMLAYACIGDCESIFFEESDGNHMDEAKFIVKNILSEFFGEFSDVYTIEYDTMVGFIMNFSEKEGVKQKYLYSVERAEEFIKKEFNVSFSMLCSNIQEGESAPVVAYGQIRDMLLYGSRSEGEELSDMFYSEVNLPDDGVLFSYPVLWEQQLLGAMRCGDTAGAIACIEEIIDSNQNVNSSIDVLRGIHCCLIGSMMKSLAEIDVTDETVCEKCLCLMEEISGQRVVSGKENFRERMVKYAEEICRLTAAGGKKSKQIHSYVMKTMQYIDENYMDQNLSLDKISDYLGIHKDYVSRLFKASKSMSVLEYINSVRMQHAIDFLEKTELTVREVAKEVGIGSVQTFNRIFKKMTGVSPSQYRSIAKK